MRPRKIVLLVDRDPVRLALRRFVLTVWGYELWGLESASEALERIERTRPLLLSEHHGRRKYPSLVMLAADVLGEQDAWLAQVHALMPLLPLLVLDVPEQDAPAAPAEDGVMRCGPMRTAEVLREVAALTTRRRGPIPNALRSTLRPA